MVVQDRPEVVVDVLDATNLERHLYLAVQFMELGIPVILALNMMDEVSRKGIELNTDKLSSLLGVPVLETIARTGAGRQELLSEAIKVIADQEIVAYGRKHGQLSNELEVMVEQVSEDLSGKLDGALTHTFLGPVIMLGILYGLFQITFGIGEIPLGWVESSLRNKK